MTSAKIPTSRANPARVVGHPRRDSGESRAWAGCLSALPTGLGCILLSLPRTYVLGYRMSSLRDWSGDGSGTRGPPFGLISSASHDLRVPRPCVRSIGKNPHISRKQRARCGAPGFVDRVKMNSGVPRWELKSLLSFELDFETRLSRDAAAGAEECQLAFRGHFQIDLHRIDL